MSNTEAWSEDMGEYIVEAHAGKRLRVIEKDGKTVMFEDPGNFPWVLSAFFKNSLAEISEDHHIRKNQEFLLRSPVGHQVNEALLAVCGDTDSEELINQTFDDLPENETAYCHAQIIERAGLHLPDGLPIAVFRDPWAFDAPV